MFNYKTPKFDRLGFIYSVKLESRGKVYETNKSDQETKNLAILW